LEKILDCELIVSSGREADEEIVHLAKSRGAFAILGQDTDYLMYDTGQVAYLSIKHLDFDTMHTYCYDRGRLARHLRIHVNQLPLIALLKGNDVFDLDELRPFHMWLTEHVGRRPNPGHHKVIEKLADYITYCKLPTKYEQIISEVPRLMDDVFGHRRFLSDAMQLIKGYFLKSVKVPPAQLTDDWSRILTELCSTTHSAVISILNSSLYESATPLEDYRESHAIPPIAFLFRGGIHQSLLSLDS
jgi:hypothetical protein